MILLLRLLLITLDTDPVIMMRLKKTNTDGFAFIELIVVIAIIGLLSAIALPMYISPMPQRRLKSAARDLYGAMQKTRLLAVKENQNKTLNFGAHSYGLDASETDLSVKYHDVAFGCSAAPGSWTGSATAANITFTPAGTSSDSTIYIQSDNTSECFAVTVALSGALKIRRFNGSTWEQ